MGIEGSNPSVSATTPLTICNNGIFLIPWACKTAPATKECYEAMRQMVGLIRRGRTFYFRRTVPSHLRPVLQEILKSAGPVVFRRDAAVSLRGTRASREFWVSLRTSDEEEARRRAIALDAEAETILQIAENCSRPSAASFVSDVDEATVRHLTSVFRTRKLKADEVLRRGDRAMTREEHGALNRRLDEDEAIARDMVARGDFREIHFDDDALVTLRQAGVYFRYGSAADRRINHAFNDAWLDAITVIRERQAGTVTPTPDVQALPPAEVPPPPPSSALTSVDLHGMWEKSEKPTTKTAEGFLRKLKSLEEFLTTRGRTLSDATTADASLWKLALLEDKSEETVANYLNATKAIIRWGFDNGHLRSNFISSIRSYSARDGRPTSNRRGFTDEEAAKILREARRKEGYRRWVPWLAHFTGARVSEICQLEKSDVLQQEKIPYIFIKGAPARSKNKTAIDPKKGVKRVKTKNANRKVPLHPALVAEGFLDFVAAQPEGPLFREITPDRYGSRGGNATKVLSRWLRNDLQINDVDLASSHSFRHRFITLCRNARVDSEIRNAIVGQSNNHISDRYGEERYISVSAKEIRKIKTLPEL
jgi:integrase